MRRRGGNWILKRGEEDQNKKKLFTTRTYSKLVNGEHGVGGGVDPLRQKEEI